MRDPNGYTIIDLIHDRGILLQVNPDSLIYPRAIKSTTDENGLNKLLAKMLEMDANIAKLKQIRDQVKLQLGRNQG